MNDKETLLGIRRGIEKESLRVLPAGGLALTPHPIALGAALTHPHITTDYSESQLELITGVHAGVDDVLGELAEIHQAVYRALADERLWVSSMPCGLPADETIPIGRYGSSNIGRAKSVYRMGLGQRYGRRMQTISGIHYNWSLPGVGTDGYFGAIRNFRREGWLLLYLFGASPALCDSFVHDRDHGLQRLSEHSLYLPHATSLRMGRLGYQSDAQASISVSYNCLDSYAASLQEALSRPYAAYEAIGVQTPGGDYNQLSTSLLQIENEFYSTIRAKRVIRSGERPLHALRERGVEYIEVRLMDLDPFEPIGIAADTIRVLDTFLLHCLNSPSPGDTPQEGALNARNQHRVAARGREPGLVLEHWQGGERTLADWAGDILAGCAAQAELLDAAHDGDAYSAALKRVAERLRNPALCPSARVLAAMAQDFDNSHVGFIRRQSDLARSAVLGLPFPTALQQRFEGLAAQSLAEQARIEAADTLDFEEFRRQYVAPERMEV
ncbi:glutamate--cysteine ligase [Roseateles asaccharophilus]|uniref:Glutamate--cysteine ligase n=1 Tax=Roseateles asaccharophilus TaxID=582607 RepID=A0ABU2A9I4_9BURK|nr:glutamate--cysteine ligase [Roseateles asaccharophilus]MDR7333253.1 glutamate--cysteine ligase [Roseateles asaccharophilus]